MSSLLSVYLLDRFFFSLDLEDRPNFLLVVIFRGPDLDFGVVRPVDPLGKFTCLSKFFVDLVDLVLSKSCFLFGEEVWITADSTARL